MTITIKGEYDMPGVSGDDRELFALNDPTASLPH